MSFHTFFDFKAGLAAPILAPSGTYENIMNHVRKVESTLGFETEQYGDNPKHWKSTRPKDGTPDTILCETAEQHNDWVRSLYEDFSRWAETPTPGGEVITPKVAKDFWHGLRMIDVPPERWTADYYKARMDAIYSAMRYNLSTDGMTFDADVLTTEQAVAVIRLFDQYLDSHDMRLEVPMGRDELYGSDDYNYCEGCGGIIHADDYRWCEDIQGDRHIGCSAFHREKRYPKNELKNT